MAVEAVVEALLSRVAAAAGVEIAKASAGAEDSSEQQQPERIVLTCGGAAAVVVVVAVVVAAAVVAGDAKIMVDQNAGAPFSLGLEFELIEFAVVPISLEQDSSTIVFAAVAADQVGHCLPAAPTLPVPYHLPLLSLIENAAAAVAAAYSEEQRTAALAADHVGNSEVPSVVNAADLATAGY